MGQAKLVSFFWADMWSHVLITLMLIWMTSCCASKTAQKIDIQAVVCPQLCTSSIHLSVTPHPSSPSNSYPTVIQILHITQTMLFLSLCLSYPDKENCFPSLGSNPGQNGTFSPPHHPTTKPLSRPPGLSIQS